MFNLPKKLSFQQLESREMFVGDIDLPLPLPAPPLPAPSPTPAEVLYQQENGLWIEQGSFQDEVAELKDNAVERNDPVTSTPFIRSQFRRLTRQVLKGNIDRAVRIASRLDYDVVEFHDTDTGKQYLGFRESDGLNHRGWGTLFVDRDTNGDDVIEIPHPRNDTDTPELGAGVFQESDAKAFLMAGAHRDSGGEDASDVAHQKRSVFHAIHKTLSRRQDIDSFWQLHGFNAEKHIEKSDFPDDAQAILSNGKATISPELVLLDAVFDDHGISSYAYNKLQTGNPVNVLVNSTPSGTVYEGTRFSPLAGKSNDQRLYSERVGDTFHHIELRKDHRTDPDKRDVVISIIAAVVDTDLEASRQRVPAVGFAASYSGNWNESNDLVKSALGDMFAGRLISHITEKEKSRGFWVDESGNPIYVLTYSEATEWIKSMPRSDAQSPDFRYDIASYAALMLAVDSFAGE